MAHLESFERSGTHRLIPAKYTKGSVLETLPLPAEVLADLSEIDAATNERTVAERGGNTAIGPSELLFGVPYAQIVNAAFCHPGPHGGRFNDPRRGAWYAGIEIETSIAEVAFHKRRFLKESRIPDRLTFRYVDFLADFSGQFHYLDDPEMANCLLPDPVPQCYAVSQALANALLYAGSNGIVYPSVRRSSGTCIACFRPALVFNPRQDRQYRITAQADSHAISVQSDTREMLSL
ncbi:MAG: RES family NAD+ phosphorylase [Acidobacteriaceae bacterium]|nr:RES family NAD+ phosphorylase [Acidobacteriaceae bacterium]